MAGRVRTPDQSVVVERRQQADAALRELAAGEPHAGKRLEAYLAGSEQAGLLAVICGVRVS